MWFLYNGRKKYINSHKELDIFIYHYFQNNKEKFRDDDPDYLLLKSFDRVHWHKYNVAAKDNNDEAKIKYECAKEYCKFKDPSLPDRTNGVALAMTNRAP